MANTTLHAAIGMGIITAIPNPYIGVPLALISHFALDRYPEWYPSDGWKRFIFSPYPFKTKEWLFAWGQLLLSSIIISTVIESTNWLYLLLAGIAANIPDITELLWSFFGKRKLWFCHKSGYCSGKLPISSNLILDTVFILIICGLVLK